MARRRTVTPAETVITPGPRGSPSPLRIRTIESVSRRSYRAALVALVVASSSIVVGATVRDHGSREKAIPAGRWVSVKPPFGYAPSPVRKYVSTDEMNVVSRVQTMIDVMESTLVSPFLPNHVQWYIEPSVRKSPTFNLQREVLYALDRVIESKFAFVPDWPVSVIIARSQDFIRKSLQNLGCVPNLSRSNGVVLMGASDCDRHIVISNITGFLFLLRADQVITRSMERRKEPSMAGVPYRVVMRNTAGLAHEYAHIWRAAAQGGRVRTDEPAWFSEGFAEFWSGVATVLQFPSRAPYLVHHIIRLRDFADWSTMCPYPLSHYRSGTPLANGCEYFVGAIALEYLYSRYSSLAITEDAFTRAFEYDSFEDGFKATYGITLSQFEKEADGYIDNLRRVEAYTRAAKRPR